MQNRFYSFIILLILSISHINAYSQKNVRISGYAPSYAKMGLVIETSINPIGKSKVELARFIIDSIGYFDVTFELETTLKATIELGKINGYIYLEPDKDYEIILPKYSPKSDADRLNPFFIPEESIIGIKNEEGVILNSMIRDFDEEFNYQYSKNILYMFHRENSIIADSLISNLNTSFPSEENSLFHDYKNFKYSLLYDASFERRKSVVLKKFFSNYTPNYNNPAFKQAFNQIYSNFLTKYMQRKKGKEVKEAFQTLKFDTLSIALKKDSIYLNDEFRELVLLKGFYDGFYTKKFSEDRILNYLLQIDSLSNSETIKAIAQQLHKQMTKLKVGSFAPEFELYQLNGKLKNLHDFKGKFIYLNFCNTQNYTCKKDMQILQQLSQDLRKDLSIITILTDEDLNSALQYIKENKFKWTILHYQNMQRIIEDYDIVALPTYYLIDPEGKLSLSPAPAPEENFLDYFTTTQKEYNYEKLRKTPQKAKSIYDL